MKLKHPSQMTVVNIILATLILAYISLVISSYCSISSTLYQNIRQTIICRTSETADVIKSEVDSIKKGLEEITQRKEIESMKWSEQLPILQFEQKRYDLNNMQIIDMNGVAKSANGFVQNVGNREYFKRAKNGSTVLTDPISNYMGPQNSIICAVPIFDENEQLVGILSASIDPLQLFTVIENRRTGSSGFCFVVNRLGKVIAHPKYQPINFQSEMTTGNIRPGEVGYGFYWLDGVENFMVLSPILGTDWSMVITVPRIEVFTELDALNNRYLLFLCVPLVLTILLACILNRYSRQNKRLESLKQDAETSTRLLRETMELDQLKTDFFANISHELRTPLAVILGTLQLLTRNIKGNPNPDKNYISRHIHTIRQNCLRSIRLSNNLIDATKIDAGSFDIHFKNCNIISLVEEITLSVADFIEGKGISIQFDTEIEEKILACDADKIERILLNLLSNAVKFTDKGGSIYVNIYDRKESVAISVKDTGIGIPEDKTNQIFERFRQVDRSTTRSNEGSGIGLSIVKSLVHMHSGTIHVLSSTGKGSEFVVELPVRVVPDADETEKAILFPDQMHYFEKINVEFSDIYK